MKTYWQNYIDGAWVDGGAGRIAVLDPATSEQIAEQALADAEEEWLTLMEKAEN